jgi:rubredoxin
MIIGVLLFQAVAFAVLSGIVANKKSRDPVGWGLLGLVFGLFGFIAALVVEEVKPKGKQPSQGLNPDEHDKKCPMCAEYIKLEAHRCKHCGHEFSEEEVEQQIEEMKQELKQRRVEKVEKLLENTAMENTAKEGLLYCERSEGMVHSDILNADGTCPVCGNSADDKMHPLVEDISGGEG